MKTQSFQRRQSGAEARLERLSAPRAGQLVILRNGQQGKVQFVSAAMKVARVCLGDGKTMRTVKLTEIMPAGSEGDDVHSLQAGRRQGAESHAESGVAYVPPYDEEYEQEEYADDHRGSDLDDERDEDCHDDRGHDRDADHGDDFDPDTDGPSDDERDKEEEARKPEVRRTMERARPVAGQRPLVSDRVAPRAEEGIAGPPKPVRREDAARLGKREPESGRPILQPSGSIRQNERLAAQAAPELETRLSRVAARAPGAKFVRLRPQKNPERVRDKVRGEDKPAETISDYLASQISADSVEAKDQVIAELKKHFKVVEVEDSFLKGREEKAGYPSANVQVMLSNGSTAEVQIVPREVQQATEQSHHFYKMGRNARDAGKMALSRHYFDQAKAINERALARFRLRNGISKRLRVT